MSVERTIKSMPTGQIFRFHPPRYPYSYDVIMVHEGDGTVSVAHDLAPSQGGPERKIYKAAALDREGVIIPMTEDEVTAHFMEAFLRGERASDDLQP